MFFVPLRVDLTLSRIPFLTILICIVCLSVFYSQYKNWQEINQASIEFCEKSQGRVFDMIVMKTYQVAGRDGCLNFIAEVLQAEDSTIAIKKVADRVPGFSAVEKARSKKLIHERLTKKYQVYESSVVKNFTAELMYWPKSYNIWNMITASVSHSSWSHIIGNLFFFFAFAASIEIALGVWRFTAAYVVLAVSTAVSYSVAMYAYQDALPTLGLSGVVMGMIGLFVYLMPSFNIRCFLWFIVIFRIVTIPAWILACWYIGWDIYNLFTDDNQSNVNFVAHVSGACFGYLFGVLFCRDIKSRVADEMTSYQRSQRRKSRYA